jgi:hypothetical protein
MGLVISKGLTLRKGYIGTDDPDAEAYIAAVEAADEAASPGIGALETATKVAIHSFVKGAKADGFWPAIKASCILAGARTLTGALVPLAGTAPTNFNFVSGDYNRKTGLVGDGSTKYLDSNRNNNADPQDSQHFSTYVTNALDTNMVKTYIGAGGISSGRSLLFNNLGTAIRAAASRSANNSQQDGNVTFSITGNTFTGVNRSSSSSYSIRSGGATLSVTRGSETPYNGNFYVFNRENGSGAPDPSNYTFSRFAFYSIGESLNLALLDARVTDLINAFAAAIP